MLRFLQKETSLFLSASMLPSKRRQTFTFFIVWQEVEAPWKNSSTDQKKKERPLFKSVKNWYLKLFLLAFCIKDQLGHWCYQKTKPTKMVLLQYWKKNPNTVYKIKETEEWQATRVNLNVLLEETTQFMEREKKEMFFPSCVFDPINTTKNINNFWTISSYLWWKTHNSYSRSPQKHCHEDGLF